MKLKITKETKNDNISFSLDYDEEVTKYLSVPSIKHNMTIANIKNISFDGADSHTTYKLTIDEYKYNSTTIKNNYSDIFSFGNISSISVFVRQSKAGSRINVTINSEIEYIYVDFIY